MIKYIHINILYKYMRIRYLVKFIVKDKLIGILLVGCKIFLKSL